MAFEPMLLKVLLVDNDVKARDNLGRALRRHRDIRILAVVDDARMAVEQAVRLEPDVVVAGPGIGVKSGLQVARAVVENRPDTAVLVISKQDSGSVIKQALRAGALGYLLWPSVMSELAKAVRALAKGRRYLGAGVADKVFDSIQASRSNPRALKGLTATEREIVRLVADGKSNMHMAQVLGLSPRTVETYRGRLMRKLGLADLPSLVKFAIRHGLTES